MALWGLNSVPIADTTMDTPNIDEHKCVPDRLYIQTHITLLYFTCFGFYVIGKVKPNLSLHAI